MAAQRGLPDNSQAGVPIENDNPYNLENVAYRTMGGSVQCDNCGKPIKSSDTMVMGKVGKYCSVDCMQQQEPNGANTPEPVDNQIPGSGSYVGRIGGLLG